MKKLGMLMVFLVCLCSFGEQPKKVFEFNSITYRIDGLTVSMLPQYGKTYGVIEAIEVSWMYVKKDSLGRMTTLTDYAMIPVSGNLRRAFFEAKNLFERKHLELEEMFEKEYLPMEKQSK